MRLHPKLGVNPVLTYCPRCGGDAPELVLAGDAWVYECSDCKQKMVGEHPENCPKCKTKMQYVRSYEPEFGERLPASQPCDKCLEEIKLHKQIVAEGGVYWKCADCKAEGVIKPNEFTEKVREKLHMEAVPGVEAAPCGVEFTKADGCPACGQERRKAEDD